MFVCVSTPPAFTALSNSPISTGGFWGDVSTQPEKIPGTDRQGFPTVRNVDIELPFGIRLYINTGRFQYVMKDFFLRHIQIFRRFPCSVQLPTLPQRLMPPLGQLRKPFSCLYGLVGCWCRFLQPLIQSVNVPKKIRVRLHQTPVQRDELTDDRSKIVAARSVFEDDLISFLASYTEHFRKCCFVVLRLALVPNVALRRHAVYSFNAASAGAVS